MDRWLYIRKKDDIRTILDALLNVGYQVMFQQDENESDVYSMQIVHYLYDDDLEMRIINLENEEVYTQDEIKEMIDNEIEWYQEGLWKQYENEVLKASEIE